MELLVTVTKRGFQNSNSIMPGRRQGSEAKRLTESVEMLDLWLQVIGIKKT